jgi:putative ABC transport system permease protein
MQTVRAGDVFQRVRIGAVSDEFFRTLGLQPAAGTLVAADDGKDGLPWAVLSDRLWTLIGRRADIVGGAIAVNGRPHAVLGITPPMFAGLQLGRTTDVWVPLPRSEGAARGDRRLALIGRLAGSTSVEEADAEVARISRVLADRYPGTNRGTRSGDEPRLMHATPYSRIDASSREQVTMIGIVLLTATGMLLLSACVNAGSLLLSRSAARRRELAVKIALGASRARLVRQIVVESLMLSLAGAAAGLLLAEWMSQVLPALFAPEEAALLDTSVSTGFAWGAMAIACIAGLLFALGPARSASRTVDAQVLRADAAGVSERTAAGPLRTVVVVGQVALATVLLIGAGLLTQALATALDGDLGPGGRGVAIALMRMPGDLEGDTATGIRFRNAALDAARKLPGARGAGWISTLPVGRSASGTFTIQTGPRTTETIDVDVNVGSPGSFSVLRQPIIEGRPFTPDDRALSKAVVLVNDVLARRYFFPTAAGRHLTDADGNVLEIVGVVRSGRHRTLQESTQPTVYYPMSQRSQGIMHLVVRTDGPADALLDPLRGMLESLRPPPQVFRVITFEAHLAEALTLDRVATTIVAVSALAALFLATIGVYGVVTDAVRRRTPEIGLRIALGAGVRQILALVFGEGFHLTFAGLGAGIGLALLLRRVAGAFMTPVPSIHLVTLAAVPVVLGLVVLGAAALPLWRALRISPTIALRTD